MLEAIENELGDRKIIVVERLELPARAEGTRGIPDAYRTGYIGNWLLSDEALKGRLWRHQALALDAFGSGRNVVLSTGTVSGKSLVFQAAAIKVLQDDDEAKVLVSYPLRALAADQDVATSSPYGWNAGKLDCKHYG